ncbi:MAG: DUF447 domain-containing protein [Candidatus Jordarchaeum sp.]|uniref:DUF447 domain-containing protein n=1 Tax=Candidatus Jordarchaeum sp. TaxID=2823881 RepID=UPI00404B6CAB
MEKLKIIPNCIYETIFTTYNADFKPNAAPMGISTPNMKNIVAKLYITSQTYRNILEKKCAVINITNDLSLFYQTSIGKKGLKEAKIFKKSEYITAPILISASAYIEATVKRILNIDENQSKITFKIAHAEIIDPCATPVCRAPNLILESIIHATRIEIYTNKKEEKKAQKLINQVKNYREIINRIAKGTEYDSLMEKIWKKIPKSNPTRN